MMKLLVMDIASGEFGDNTTKLVEAAKRKYIQNHQNKEILLGSDSDPANKQVTNKSKGYARGFWKQFIVLLWSNLIRVWRNRVK